MQLKVLVLGQVTKVLLQGVAACAGELDCLGHRDASVLTGKLDNLQRQREQRRQYDPLTFDFLFQPSHLLGQRSQEEHYPAITERQVAFR